MDPEIQREYEEHMRTMVDLLNQQAAATSKLLNSLQSTSAATTAVKNNADATKKQTDAISGSTKAMEAGAIAQQKYAEAAANFSRGLINGQAAVMSFGNAILSTQKNLEKYGSAFNAAGSAAWDIGKNFGILGMAAGGLLKGVGFLAEGMFKAVDSVVQFRDDAAKLGGVMPITLSGIQELGSNARFSGEEIAKLTKVMGGFGTSIIGLGGTAGEGQVKFMQLAAVTDDTRRRFGRLGVDQERLLEMQGMYIQMQGISGKALENRTKTEAQLQRESLAYAKNLIIMSDLTGQTAEQMQKEREVVKAEFEEQVKIRQENIQIQRLRASGDHAAADAIKKEQDNRTHLIQTMTDTYGREIGSQFGRLARTGVYDQFTGGLATLGVSATEVSNLVKNSGNIQADSLKQVDKVTTLQSNMVESVGDAFQFMGEESARSLLGSTEAIAKGNNLYGKSVEKEVAQIQKTVADKEAEGDAMADAVEAVRSAEREIQKLYYDSMFALAEVVLPKFAGALEYASTKLVEMIEYLKTNFDNIIAQIQKWGPVIATVAGTVVGALLSLKIGRGVASIFSSIIGAGRGLIGWMKRVTSTSLGGPGGGPDVDGPDNDRRRSRGRGLGGKLLRFGRGLAGGLGGLLGGLALDYGADKATEAGYVKTGAGLNTASYAATGAGFGATLGSVVPGLGTLAGGAIGGLLGGAYGLYQNWDTLTGSGDDAKELAETQKTNTEKQSTAAAEIEAASENFTKTVDDFALVNKNSFDQTLGADSKEIEALKEANKKKIENNSEIVDRNSSKFSDSTKQTIADIEQRKILAKNSQDQMIKKTALFKLFTEAMDAATLMVKTLTESMQNLVNQIGTNLLQLMGGSLGGGADSPADVDSFLAMTEKLESAGGTILTPLGMSNTGTIGGRYHMGDAARETAFANMTPDERRQMASLGFTSAPTLRQLVSGTGKDAKFVSPQAEQADRLLGRAGARRTISQLQQRGLTGTMAEARSMWWLGEGGFDKFTEALRTNPNMPMADLLPNDDNRQYHGRTVAQQAEFVRGKVNEATGGGPEQQRIRQLAATLQREGFRISGHPEFNPTSGHSEGSHHPGGRAIDINIGTGSVEWENPQHKERFDALATRLKGEGFEVIWGTDDQHKNHMHVELAKGGIVSGPTSGYPATLHGTEVVTPLNMDSILMRLAKTPAGANDAGMMMGGNISNEALERMSFAQKEMIDVLTRKLDNVIDALDNGNDTRSRILKNSMI